MSAQPVRSRRSSTTPLPSPFASSTVPQPDWHRLLEVLKRAMFRERDSVQESGGTAIAIRDLIREGEADGAHRVRFRLGRARTHLKPGSLVTVSAGSTAISGYVVDQEGHELSVALTRPLPALPTEEIFLRSDSAFLWDAVIKRLAGVWPGRSDEPPDGLADPLLMAALLQGRHLCRPEPLAPCATSLLRLNAEQGHALRETLRCAVYFLWGPPGTGKSTTLTEAVVSLLARGRRVLVVTGSNAAADVITSMIARRLPRLAAEDPGSIVRAGSGTGVRVKRRWGHLVDPVTLARRRAEEASESHRRHSAIEGALETLESRGVADRRLRESRRSRRGIRVPEGAPASPEFVVRGARVVVTTTHHLAVAGWPARCFDAVIIDEASQISLPLVLLAAAHARESVLVAGDPMQLPPVIVAREAEVKRVLGRSIFETAGITAQAQSPISTMLRQQHRMAPEISDLVSDLAYQGRLRPHTTVLTRPISPIRRELGGLLLLDTGAAHPRVRRLRNGSRANDTHVGLVGGLLHGLDQAGLIAGGSVSVIAPFRAQVARLSSEVAGQGVSASTAHACQGAEADIIVLDLTDAPGAPISRFLAAPDATDAGGCLLTVSLSRAREALIVVADAAFLQHHGGPYLRRLLHLLGRRARALPLHGHLTPRSPREGPGRAFGGR